MCDRKNHLSEESPLVSKPIKEESCHVGFYSPSVTSWGLEVRSLAGSSAKVAREVVAAPDSSLIGSLRLVSGMLSRELNLTRELDLELRSGLVSDKPGISSILVGVTMNRTEAILVVVVVVSGGCIFLFFFSFPFKGHKGKTRKNPSSDASLLLMAKLEKITLKKKTTTTRQLP